MGAPSQPSISLQSMILTVEILLLLAKPISPSAPTPSPWPHQFHSILFLNYSGALSLIDLWYDWPNGRNFNIIQDQLGTLVYDLEWNNGTSFIYTLDSSRRCRTAHLDVGILRPNWLDGAVYLGQEYVDGFLCNVWEKVEFIWYYEDVVTKRPVHWVFYTALEDAKWQAPVYCFQKENEDNNQEDQSVIADGFQETLEQKIALRTLFASET
ncbi:hypothetical protein ACLOJK_019620 [Asimina triloba]